MYHHTQRSLLIKRSAVPTQYIPFDCQEDSLMSLSPSHEEFHGKSNPFRSSLTAQYGIRLTDYGWHNELLELGLVYINYFGTLFSTSQNVRLMTDIPMTFAAAYHRKGELLDSMSVGCMRKVFHCNKTPFTRALADLFSAQGCDSVEQIREYRVKCEKSMLYDRILQIKGMTLENIITPGANGRGLYSEGWMHDVLIGRRISKCRLGISDALIFNKFFPRHWQHKKERSYQKILMSKLSRHGVPAWDYVKNEFNAQIGRNINVKAARHPHLCTRMEGKATLFSSHTVKRKYRQYERYHPDSLQEFYNIRWAILEYNMENGEIEAADELTVASDISRFRFDPYICWFKFNLNKQCDVNLLVCPNTFKEFVKKDPYWFANWVCNYCGNCGDYCGSDDDDKSMFEHWIDEEMVGRTFNRRVCVTLPNINHQAVFLDMDLPINTCRSEACQHNMQNRESYHDIFGVKVYMLQTLACFPMMLQRLRSKLVLTLHHMSNDSVRRTLAKYYI